ncbi:type I 3-dehydroquinate dehydratase [Alkalihalobacillus sp. MEB130]|uniref:type I 3-dehydroquinate dehydratase n=1 Tax=Alkalihalobacillus sp. MEB130 TaxID=2976704 RepID=UPI0028DFCE71|nr:type I 3-dehydroquinate dehydratase [Alkalihalobacillus sp. MEB130]MDT8859732.1 type I 3-dehydroquinate dehydratase [Alkalihalobacillus sp. MEB130]
MKKIVNVKGVNIGEGMPKICVPMVGSTLSELLEEATNLQNIDAEIIEWRVDFFDDVMQVERVKEALTQIQVILKGKPLIFTFRTMKEGGKREIGDAEYVTLNREVIKTGLIDIIDIELFNDEDIVTSLVLEAHEHNVFVILSNHEFEETPSKEEIVSRLVKAQELGGDIPKIAVMPKNSADVLTLLDATNTMKHQYAEGPIITMSMAGQGVISRLAGEIFGSAITFGAANKASAPGQVAIAELRQALVLLHQNA